MLLDGANREDRHIDLGLTEFTARRSLVKEHRIDILPVRTARPYGPSAEALCQAVCYLGARTHKKALLDP